MQNNIKKSTKCTLSKIRRKYTFSIILIDYVINKFLHLKIFAFQERQSRIWLGKKWLRYANDRIINI